MSLECHTNSKLSLLNSLPLKHFTLDLSSECPHPQLHPALHLASNPASRTFSLPVPERRPPVLVGTQHIEKALELIQKELEAEVAEALLILHPVHLNSTISLH